MLKIKVLDIIKNLQNLNITYDVYDPYANYDEVYSAFGIKIIKEIKTGVYDAALVTVAHDVFKELGTVGVRQFLKPDGIIFDVKAIYPRADTDLRL